MNQEAEIRKRRTFAIISHPDAGKTTLTEKFLLFGGAIQTAGAVKSNKIRKTATSDFMEIEKQRGISVATSVMGFVYQGVKINLLDTPGHTGNFKIGASLTEGEPLISKGIQSFSPEFFREVINDDLIKTKQLEKGLKQLTDEGVAQLFTGTFGNRKIIGTVGELRFDVIQFRLTHEPGALCSFSSVPLYKACLLSSDDDNALEEFIERKSNSIAFDKDQRPVFMAESKAYLQMVIGQYLKIKFDFMSEHQAVEQSEYLKESNFF